jgi:exopolysaccharide production protein ExoQ
MPTTLAAAAFAVGIAGLFYLDRDRNTRTSPALWLAIVWMAIGASRMLSQWIGTMPVEPAEESLYVDGSPVDRIFLSALLFAALVVLVIRAKETGRLLRTNAPIVIFFVYCAMSLIWSDHQFVAFKRWTKALGNIAMILVILTDPAPYTAVKRALTRTGFLLIPLSMLYIKYFPDLGRTYNRWTWTSWNIGVATDKNGLGALCVVFGLASLWCFLEAHREHSRGDRQRVLIAHGATVGMALWVLIHAQSATSLACFGIGAMVLVLTMRPGGLRPATVNTIIGALAAGGAFVLMYPQLYAYFVRELGRNTTLTGRTEMWNELFRMITNPLLGTGFESFWLGSRAERLWNMYYFHPNQAHNGYVETYINLGWIGLALFMLLVISCYRNLLRMDRGSAGSLCLTYFAVALIYNVTEAAFKVMHPVWIAFLLAAVRWPPLSDPIEERAASIEEAPSRWARQGRSRGVAARSAPQPAAVRSLTARVAGR